MGTGTVHFLHHSGDIYSPPGDTERARLVVHGGFLPLRLHLVRWYVFAGLLGVRGGRARCRLHLVRWYVVAGLLVVLLVACHQE